MGKIYLSEFKKLAKNGIAYIPIGTIEWHGNVLPIETDFLVAQKICEKLNKIYPGYILPPFYMGAYGKDIINGQEMRGMDRKLGKKLVGNIYFLEGEKLIQVLRCLIENLKAQGFTKIIIITGHGGSNQEAVLNEISDIESVIAIDPYEPVSIHHADEGEISVFWACYPNEQKKALKDKDIINYYGYDPLEKSSLKYGQELLNIMIGTTKEKVRKFVGK